MSSKHVCPICQGSTEIVRPFAHRKQEDLNLAACQQCGLEFLSPQPSGDWLGEEYAQYHVRHGIDVSLHKSAHFTRLLERLPIDFTGKRVLEFGAAEGNCIKAVRRKAPTAHITAVEANISNARTLKPLADETQMVSVEEWLSRSNGKKYDVVMMFDVLEHLRDPVAVVKKLRKSVLNENGYLIATFPVCDSLSRRAMGRLWPHYKVEHLFYFTKEALGILAKESGLKPTLLVPLKKYLSLEYYLQVVSHFGPKETKSVGRLLSAVTPTACKKMSLNLASGEALWVAQNRAG